MVRWLGVRGMGCSALLRLLFDQETKWGRPECVVVSLGGQQSWLYEQCAPVKRDLRRLCEAWPGVNVVWSDIVPQSVWRGSRDVGALERARRKVNHAVSQFVLMLGGVAVRHPLLGRQSPQYFARNGMHLSTDGTGVLLQDVFSQLG